MATVKLSSPSMTLKCHLMVNFRVHLSLTRLVRLSRTMLTNKRGHKTLQLRDKDGVATHGVRLVPYYRVNLYLSSTIRPFCRISLRRKKILEITQKGCNIHQLTKIRANLLNKRKLHRSRTDSLSPKILIRRI